MSISNKIRGVVGLNRWLSWLKCQVVMPEVVSSTPAGPTLRVLK